MRQASTMALRRLPGAALLKGTLPVLMSASVAFLALACDTTETVTPLPSETGTTGSTTGSAGTGTDTGGTAGSGGTSATAPLRTIMQRNPFGNVAAGDNLLWDGDFEWTSPFADQYGWLYGPPYDADFPPATIGAACRSGVKCLTLPKNKSAIGIGVGGATETVSVTLFVRPESDSCADIDVSLFDPFSSTVDAPIAATSAAPDSSGWCLFEGTVESYAKKAYLLIDNNTKGAVVVDDAVVRSAPSQKGAVAPPLPPMLPPSLERQLRRDEARAAILALRRPSDPPPSPARRAFEEQHRR